MVESTLSPGLFFSLNSEFLSDASIETFNDQVYDLSSYYHQRKLNINEVTEEQLLQTGILTMIQIVSFIGYRETFGPFTALEELQAVPYWSAETAKSLAAIMSLQTKAEKLNLKTVWKESDNELLMTSGYAPQLSRGFKPDTTTGKTAYNGPPVSGLLKIRQKMPNGLHWGFCLENDKGESLSFKRNILPFDHVSKSVSYNSERWIKSLIVGDYQVNVGLGLIQWQSFGMAHHTIDINSLVNNMPAVKPYWGRGEDNYHSGIAASIQKKKWVFSGWMSDRKKDAVLRIDSISGVQFITTQITGGVHRSDAELRSRKTHRERMSGARLAYHQAKWKIGMNVIAYSWIDPFIHDTSKCYEAFSFNGNRLTNFSLDGSLSYKSLYFFNECAFSHPGGAAIVNGCIVSLSEKLDMAVLYRNISKKFESRYASTYTIGYQAQNESGVSLLVNYSFSKKSKWYYRFDLMKNPWLNYGETLRKFAQSIKVSWHYQPSKQSQIIISVAKRENDNETKTTYPLNHKENYQASISQIDCNVKQQVSNSIIFNSQMVIKITDAENWGWLLSMGLQKKWLEIGVKANASLTFFHSNNYANRIYLIENELFNAPQLVTLYDQGARLQFHLEKKCRSPFSFSIYASHNQYLSKEMIGSGLDEIVGSGKTSIAAGIKWLF